MRGTCSYSKVGNYAQVFEIWNKVRVQVLGKTPFPSLDETFSHVLWEEGYRTKNPYKDHMQCEYRGKLKNTKETCWKLHGRPTRGRGGKQANPTCAQANLSETTESSKDIASTETFSSNEV
ncbi:ankyrin repeat domain-containing protein 2b [Gossypium australe]|uniref:Ankyrin repeat domain-containing protein 2b n=1 Tax=Gossypium australe TaxID=47621 RepID=A0A5B6VN43_9ROSI|nr:ankyrin repeat domain-containing protein 2b [Gossypium australe]